MPAPQSGWQTATVLAVRPETARAKTFRLRLHEQSAHLAGQHYVIRLTAPDGYTAARSYSIASAPDGTDVVEFTVERLDGGEVSMFLHDEVVPGDDLDVRGPIGGWFVWRGDCPALLVGGGSGLVPLMAMLRLARRTQRSHLIRLVVSVRSPEDLYYADEVVGPETSIIYTRSAPSIVGRPAGRLTGSDVVDLTSADQTVFVCGSTGFANSATDVLIDAGIAADRIRVERFGPSR